MARMEMSAIPASLAIPMEASADAYYELGLMHASGRSGPVGPGSGGSAGSGPGRGGAGGGGGGGGGR